MLPSDDAGTLAGFLEYGLLMAARSRTEPRIVQRFVDFIQDDVKPKFHSIDGKPMKLRAKMIHQKPYALLEHQICGKSKVELGDILFVLKRKGRRSIWDCRCSFAQAKLYRKSWNIEAHQYQFLCKLASTRFRLAKNPERMLELRNCSDLWSSSYLLMSKSLNLSIPPPHLSRFYEENCSNFKVDCCLLGTHASNFIWYCPRWAFREFIMKFVKRNGVGAIIRGDLREVLEICYEKVGLAYDPPRELFMRDGAFAVIEFEITEDELEEERR